MSAARVATEVRQSIRNLMRRRSYAAASVATLALVMSANAALFATVNATLLRPVPLAYGDRAMRIYTLPPGSDDPGTSHHLHQAELIRFREASGTLVDLASWTEVERILDGDEPRVVRVSEASAELFGLVPAGARLGRGYTKEEDRNGAAVAVLSYNLWQEALGADPTALGRTIHLDGIAHEIVGVMPVGFPPRFMEADLWRPLGVAARVEGAGSGRANLKTVGRLAAGATLADAHREIASLMAGVVTERPDALVGWRAGVMSVREWAFGDLRTPVLVLQGAMILLLLVACINVGGLALARVGGRSAELGLRRALGASRRDVARLVFIEVVVLNALGAVLGFVAAGALLPVLLSIDPAATHALGPVTMDWRVATYGALSALIASVVASVVPIRQAVSAEAPGVDARAGHRTHGGRGREGVRAGLLAAQTAVCVALLASGGLLLRALDRSAAVNPGFDPVGVLTAQLRLPRSAYANEEARVRVVSELLERLAAIPGVTAASTGLNDFIPGNAWTTMVRVEERPTPDGAPHPVQFRRVSPGYFRVMGTSMVRGRDFEFSDRTDAAPVMIVSESFATEFWPGGDAVGRQVQRSNATWTVIGVAADVADVDPLRPPEPTVYVAWAQASNLVGSVAVVLRTDQSPAALATTVRAEIRQIDPTLVLDRILPLEDFLDDALAPARFRAVLLLVLAFVGLVLGALGSAALTAQALAERRGELGVRLALGAARSRLWTAVVTRQFRHAGVGAAIGVVLAVAMGRGIAAVLPDVQAFDMTVVLGAALLLLLTAVISAAGVGARVLRFQPQEVLRS